MSLISLDMTLENLKRIALSTRSQSFVSIEAWELLALVEVAQCLSSVACEGDMRENLCCYIQGARALEILDKLTSGGEPA